MDDIAKQFNKIFDKANKATNTATYRALNKSVAKIKTRYQKALAESTGLKTSVLKPRLNTSKASSKSLRASAGFGTKYGVALGEFKTKTTNVKIGKGKKSRKVKGVTVIYPDGRQELVQNGWKWKAQSGKSLVLQRLPGQNKTSLPREEVSKYALKLQPELNKEYAKEFKEQFSAQLKYELSKK